MECNCNNNNSNGGVIPWVRGNRLPLIICVYENVVTQEQVGDSTLTVNEMTRVPYTIQDNDTVTVIMKSGFRQVEMPFTTDGNKVMVTDNGELPTGAYTVEVTIERGDGARGRWQETRQVRIYENTSDAQLGEMYSIDADLFFYAKGDTGTGIADITNNPDNTLTITMTDGTTYTTEAVKGEKGDKGDTGERGVSIVSFDVTGQTDVSVIYTVTFSDDTTQDISVPKGPQGDTGLTGNGISTTTLNSDYTLTIAYTDGTTYTTPSIRGAQGAQGVSVIGFTQTGETATNTMYNLVFSDGRTQSVAIPKGTKGDKGDTGNTGAQGAQGPKGDTVIIGDEQTYTLYGVTGQNTDGAMTQKAVTDNFSGIGDSGNNADLDIADETGYVIARFENGDFKVKNFDSSKVNIETGDDLSADLDIEDENGKVLARFSGGHFMTKYFDSASKAERPSSGYEVFTYMVDTTIPTRRTSAASVQDSEDFESDKGIVMLPESYTSNGKPTRLVMFGHGLGGVIRSNSTSLSQSSPLHSALLADGYAIFEINGTPGIENANYSHFGGPVWVRSCIAAYKYLVDKYNFRTDGILTYGYSLGGLGTLQLPNFNLPVIAQVTYAGVYDQFKSSYSKETAAGKADFLARFGMTDYGFTLTDGGANVVPPQQEREYIIEHRDMWARYADLAYGVTTTDIARMYSVWPAPSVVQDSDEEAIYDGLVINNRPPCLFIQGESDTTIVKRYTVYLAAMIGNSGRIADVRFFSGGTHQNILTVGDNVSYTAANGQTLTLNASSYEGLLFLKRFNH